MNLANVIEEPCPACAYKLHFELTVTPKGPWPAPGAVTVCVACGELLAFDWQCHVYRAPPVLLGALSYEARTGLNQIVAQIKRAKARRERRAKLDRFKS